MCDSESVAHVQGVEALPYDPSSCLMATKFARGARCALAPPPEKCETTAATTPRRAASTGVATASLKSTL